MHWSEIGRYWGTTAAERQRVYPCDAVLPDSNENCFRGVSIATTPATVFRWLCQLRIAPYSYDLIDNFPRRSPPTLTAGADVLELGQPFMKIFDLVEFERNVHITLRLRRPGLFPPLAVTYLVDATGERDCRLLVKLVAQVGTSALRLPIRTLGPWLDLVMMRRQLLNLKVLAERSDQAGY